MRCPRCGETLAPGPPTWAPDVCKPCDAELEDAEEEAHPPLTEASIDDLIAKSSIGAALADIEARGLEAHLQDLEAELDQVDTDYLRGKR